MDSVLETATPIFAGIVKDDRSGDVINNALDFVRSHLGMEVAYLSEFVDDELIFRAVSAPGLQEMIDVGDTMPLDQVYCPHILDGRLPELIPDTADIPFAQTIALTHDLPIRSHVSVPIRRKDGSTYGMFCCLSRQPQKDLNGRDLDVMRAFAQISSEQINDSLSLQIRQQNLRRLFRGLQAQKDFDVVYQPIMDISTQSPKGFEALCRFRGEPYRPPNVWFDEAAEVGQQANLEICVMEAALNALHSLPDDIYISVNASPATVETGRLCDVFAQFPAERIVLEVTEHAEIADVDLLMKELSILRMKGIRLAVDDAGAGYSGLQQIVRLRPDIIKLDISLTKDIDQDVVRRSLGAALVNFACMTNTLVVAEGIETEQELETLKSLCVPLGQGYLLGRPGDLQQAKAWFDPKSKLSA